MGNASHEAAQALSETSGMHETDPFEVRCCHCGAWFESPIPMTDASKYSGHHFLPVFTICTDCHKAVPCQPDNTRSTARRFAERGQWRSYRIPVPAQTR